MVICLQNWILLSFEHRPRSLAPRSCVSMTIALDKARDSEEKISVYICEWNEIGIGSNPWDYHRSGFSHGLDIYERSGTQFAYSMNL